MNTTAKPSRIRERINKLGDIELAELITALKFSTKLEQSTLHHAQAEKRRRARLAKAKAGS